MRSDHGEESEKKHAASKGKALLPPFCSHCLTFLSPIFSQLLTLQQLQGKDSLVAYEKANIFLSVERKLLTTEAPQVRAMGPLHSHLQVP